MKKRILIIIVSLFLAVFLIGQVYGWGIDYVIEPNQEATEIIPLTPSSSVIGNISATGSINFYVSSPSGNVVYYSNDITSTSFSFTARENGNYTLHILNVNQTENVTATLSYSKNLVVVLTETLKTTSTQTATLTSMIPPNTTVTTPNPIDPIGVPSFLVSISFIVGYVYRKFKEWLQRRKAYEPIDYSIHYNSFKRINEKSAP